MAQVTASPPTSCPLCNAPLASEAYDARIQRGPFTGTWAWMCPECFSELAGSLGTGSGQHYCRHDGGAFIKVEG